jgi:hypothetical protein
MMTIANNDETNSKENVAQFPAPETSSEQNFSTTLFAQPYNLDAQGFYFHDAEEFENKSESLLDRFGSPVEEFEIQFIDGDDAALFDACGIDQSNLITWFEDIEVLDDHEKLALYFLTSELGYSLDDAINKIDEVSIFHGDAQEAAEELFDDCYAHAIPDNLRFYFDMEKFARDLEIGGDFNEFEYQGQTYTCTNACGI